MEEGVIPVLQIGPDAFILPILLILISIILIRFVKFKNWLGEPFKLIHLAWAIPVLIALLFVGIGTDIIANQLGVHDTQAVEETIDVIASDQLTGILFLITSALGEELFFRGILYALIGALSIPIFALVHAGYHSTTQIIAALLGGIVLFLARQKTTSIYPGLIAHFLYNLLAVFFIHF